MSVPLSAPVLMIGASGPVGRMVRQLDAAKLGAMPETLVVLAGITPGSGVDETALNGNRPLAEACLETARAPVSAFGRAKLAVEDACATATAPDPGAGLCPLPPEENLPETMAQQWRATWP